MSFQTKLTDNKLTSSHIEYKATTPNFILALQFISLISIKDGLKPSMNMCRVISYKCITLLPSYDILTWHKKCSLRCLDNTLLRTNFGHVYFIIFKQMRMALSDLIANSGYWFSLILRFHLLAGSCCTFDHAACLYNDKFGL